MWDFILLALNIRGVLKALVERSSQLSISHVESSKSKSKASTSFARMRRIWTSAKLVGEKTWLACIIPKCYGMPQLGSRSSLRDGGGGTEC
jgi:hypothetical protein